MKILYAIQGTGNGHIARAIDLVPEFEKYAEVDVLLSGQHSELKLPFVVKYRMQGLGFFFGNQGGIDIKKTWKKNSLGKFFSEVVSLPVGDYDFVISDFEPVSAWACYLKGKKCFGMSNQAAVMNPLAPKPDHYSLLGQIILRFYAPVRDAIGFHFKQLNEVISTPVIRKGIRKIEPRNKGHYTVYLPSYSDINIIGLLASLNHVNWHVFSKFAGSRYSFNNVSIHPVDDATFVESLSNCAGVICNAGFETPAEALYLGKKLCVVPMKNQYEQHCNAAMLKSMGVTVLNDFSKNSIDNIEKWIIEDNPVSIRYPDNVPVVVEQMFRLAAEHKAIPEPEYNPVLVGAG